MAYLLITDAHKKILQIILQICSHLTAKSQLAKALGVKKWKQHAIQEKGYKYVHNLDNYNIGSTKKHSLCADKNRNSNVTHPDYK